MIPTHLMKKGETTTDANGKPYLYGWTEALAKREDMIPCDFNGVPVGVAGQIASAGFRPAVPAEPDPELLNALGVIDKLQKELAALKANAPIPATESDELDLTAGKMAPAAAPGKVDMTENTDPPPTLDPVIMKDLTRNKLWSHMIRAYGREATAHLRGNMSKETLLPEAEKLQAAVDLQISADGAGGKAKAE